jgi:hypothetical protein
MKTSEILATLDREIAALQQARSLLTSGSVSHRSNGTSPKKRNLSPEARERIAAAQRKRWAAKKKSTK